MNWEEVEVLVDVVRFHHHRLLEKHPALIAQVDQDIMEYRKLIQQMGVPIEAITARDFFMLMQGLLMTQKISYMLKDRAELKTIEMIKILSATTSTALAIIGAINPALLDAPSSLDDL